MKTVDLALSEIGYKETPDNINKYAEYLDSIPDFYNGKKNGFAWCDVFFDYLFVKSYGVEKALKMIYQPKKSTGAGCAYSCQFYMQNKAFFGRPKIGDQIFFERDGYIYHTGIVVDVVKGSVITVEGNTSDGVYKRTYDIDDSRIFGYGRPDYSIADDMQTVENPVETVKKETCSIVLNKLHERDTGLQVKMMQYLIRQHGGSVGIAGIDGVFGSDTLLGLKQFQLKSGITVTGTCDLDTWHALISDT